MVIRLLRYNKTVRHSARHNQNEPMRKAGAREKLMHYEHTNLHDDIADGLLSRLRKYGFLCSPRSLDDGGEIEADSSVQEAPE